jgi:hypothetical protein
MAETLTSERGLAMLEECPWYYQTSRVFQSHLEAAGREMDDFHIAIDEVLNQLFVNTATWGLDAWEQELNLSSFAGKPDDQRRSRIISKIRGIGNINVTLVKNVVESYVYGTVDLIDHPELYRFTIKFTDIRGIPANLPDVQAAIEDIKPVHLAVEYQFIYTTWSEVKALTWGEVKTGTWDELRIREIV